MNITTEPRVGIEPTTCGLQNRCSGRLSYLGDRRYYTLDKREIVIDECNYSCGLVSG